MKPLAYQVRIKHRYTLDDYRDYPGMEKVIDDIETRAKALKKRLKGRKLWMVNSTETGGGVAEMLPTLISLMQQVGLPIEWLVITPAQASFFIFTKKIHNFLHGRDSFDSKISKDEIAFYEEESCRISEQLVHMVNNKDLMVVHDPQPLAACSYLVKEHRALKLLWRCHIGTEHPNKFSNLAWRTLRPYFASYRETFFTHPEYVPAFLRKKSDILYPCIDPLSYKNMTLGTAELLDILRKAGMNGELLKGFKAPVQRLMANGRYSLPKELRPLTTPIILQISRWDHLKGFIPLMKGFLYMKRKVKETHYKGLEDISRRMIRDAKLVLAGPAAGKVADDPEPAQVVEEVLEFYRSLSREEQKQIYLLFLPMDSTKQNALICNALQRSASVIVQNSIREGFGLTVTEALWKDVPVMATTVGGIRLQVESGRTGMGISEPYNSRELGAKLLYMLTHKYETMSMTRHGWSHVFENFLTPVLMRRYLEIFTRHLR